MRLSARLVAVLVLVAPALASAQTPEAREVVFRDGESVRGDRTNTDVENLIVHRDTTRTSLIRIRAQFVDRILDSAAGL